jgi:lipopolysaccharide transport system ATP-binding protein
LSETAIKVENLSKRYRIGATASYKTLRESLVNFATAPFHRSHAAPEDAIGQKPRYVWALKDVSFEIKRGQATGIIGANGSGKSTMLKILSRITLPSEGRATIYGRVSSLLEVGTGFHPELTGRENIQLNAAVLGMPKAEVKREFDSILDFAGDTVKKYIDTPVKRYSSGMYVRLAFAIAAHVDPDVLLVDEVLAVGDAEFQKKCIGKMGEVARTGRTVIFVSHNMGAIKNLCENCILLESGKVKIHGPTDECISQYLPSVPVDSPSVLDTSKIVRIKKQPELGTALRITGVRLHSDSDTAIIKTGAPLFVDMDFECSEPLEDVTLGFAVEMVGGQRVLDVASAHEFIISYMKPSKYRISGGLDRNPLAPGRYNLVVGARCQKKGLDWLPEVMSFSVTEEENYNYSWLAEKTGLVRLPERWIPPENVRIRKPD